MHAGYNQLVFDDSDEQLRTQLKSTTAASELNLGHLIHQADNYRGSFRGTGVELRTDAWGALRGGQGVIMSTWAQTNDGEPAGDLAAGMALLNQAGTLADTLSGAARTHQTVQLAASIGSDASEKSKIDPTPPRSKRCTPCSAAWSMRSIRTRPKATPVPNAPKSAKTPCHTSPTRPSYKAPKPASAWSQASTCTGAPARRSA